MEITHTISELYKRGVHKERLVVPAPKNKAETQLLYDMFIERLGMLGSETKHIKKEIHRLRAILEK